MRCKEVKWRCRIVRAIVLYAVIYGAKCQCHYTLLPILPWLLSAIFICFYFLSCSFHFAIVAIVASSATTATAIVAAQNEITLKLRLVREGEIQNPMVNANVRFPHLPRHKHTHQAQDTNKAISAAPLPHPFVRWARNVCLRFQYSSFTR